MIYFGFNPDACLAISKTGAILADENLLETHGLVLQKSLNYELIAVPSGEKHKTRETKEALEDELLRRKLGRDSAIVALGGGVTTDLVGFVASTYMRGVPLILIPTTLLGMVDAAIGGKTGVNTPFGKNTIGSFYLPKAIFIDEKFLRTLSEKELKNGLSEILKYGLIAEREIWEKGKNWKEELPFLIRASIRCKMEIVEQDFDEKRGLREALNFGHTVGHALELISDFQMSHGEAVALGCMAECYLSWRLGYLKELEEILAVYRDLGYRFKPFDRTAFVEAMGRDKKSKGGEIRCVLIDRIGHSLPLQKIGSEELNSMIDWMEHG